MSQAKFDTHRHFFPKAYVAAIGWEMLVAAMHNGNRAVVLCAPRASRDREDFGQDPPTLRRFNRGVRAHADT